MMRAFRHRSEVVDWRFTTGVKDARHITAKRELSRLHQLKRLPLTLAPSCGGMTLRASAPNHLQPEE